MFEVDREESMANAADGSPSKDHHVAHATAKHQEKGEPLAASSSSSSSSPSNDNVTNGPDAYSHEPANVTISRLLKGKEREWDAVKNRSGPLQLLDLPVDILRLMVKEITHTNDLTSLALTNSTLYNLSVPHIYARFDIVWPDANVPASESKSVDALTYGLSTLCLGSKFAQRSRWLNYENSPSGRSDASHRLANNQYAKYTRKFSLGNGPADWVAEYMISKESGKMLGTLVALAVAKMVNLETFVWDMPTGVLSDIFMALASLRDLSPEGETKLEKFWVRWHDNTEINLDSPPTTATTVSHQPFLPAGSSVTPIGVMLPADGTHPNPRSTFPYSQSNVEYPTFSVLPPLRSLSVLDIDEISYLDEMALLIERSKSILQELRVGVSAKALHKDFIQAWDGSNLQQVDHDAGWPGESRIGERRLGGVLGVLVGRIYDIRRKKGSKKKPDASSAAAQEIDTLPGSSNATAGLSASNNSHSALLNEKTMDVERKRLDGKLRIHTLELERVPLSMHVCSKAIDWSVLTDLTLLQCSHNEGLWKVLKRQFQPTLPPHGSPPGTLAQYYLNLKKLHTDLTSIHLISFIKETLAPNSLEVLFLQDRRRGGPPSVTVNQIFRGAIKRHRASLRKLLLDSSEKNTVVNVSPTDTRWNSWVLTSEMVQYITSGRMGNLRELSASLEYKDWHPFLQRLPNIPQLRSLYVPYISDHIVGNFQSRELACQIVDIITLRPEIQLCYVGISTKCFEILEARPSEAHRVQSDHAASGSNVAGFTNGLVPGSGDDEAANGNDGSEDDEEGGEESSEDDDDDDTHGDPTDAEDDQLTEASDDSSSLGSGHHDSDDDEEELVGGETSRLRLREILFYDDKVAIFKARHARL